MDTLALTTIRFDYAPLGNRAASVHGLDIITVTIYVNYWFRGVGPAVISYKADHEYEALSTIE